MPGFTSSLTSPALRFAANEIIMSLRKEITPVTQFTTNFTAEAVTKGTTLLIPIIYDTEAGEFNRESNNYLTPNGSLMYTPMKFDTHIKHSFGFTANDFNLVNGTSFWSKSAESSTRALSRKIANTVFGLINATNIPTSGTDQTEITDKDGNVIGKEGTPLEFSSANEYVVGSDAFSKSTAAMLRDACDKADIAAGDTILALNPVKFAELLATLDAQLYGGPEAIRSGIVPNLYGYKAVVEVNEMPGGVGGNQIGALIPATSMAIASRILPVLNPKLYDEVGVTTDEKSGLAVQLRRAGNVSTDDSVATAEVLFSAKLIQPTKIVRLVKTATPSPTGETGSSGETGETGETGPTEGPTGE